MTRRPPRRPLPSWALAAGGLAAALLLAEGLLRATGLGFPRFWRHDPVVGLSLKPGAAGWFVDEGRAYVRVNSDGFRDRERSREKPAGTFRALVLGDSFTEAVQVPLEDTFEQVAERRLASCPALKGRPAEVLNWGVRGYGTVEELELLRMRGESFRPDVVVLAHYPETDLLDNLRALGQPPGGRPLIAARDGRWDFTPDVEDAAVRYDEARLADRPEPFPANLRLAELARAAASHWSRRDFWRRGRDDDPESASYPAGRVYRPPTTEAWRRAWEVQEGLLGLLRREAAARGFKVLMLLVSSPVQVLPDPAQRARFAALWGAKDMDYPNERLTADAKRLGFALVDTVPLIDAEVRRAGRPAHGFANTRPGYGHWNAEGHAVVGAALGEALCRMAAGSGKER